MNKTKGILVVAALLAICALLLAFVDVIERLCQISPRTKEIRERAR